MLVGLMGTGKTTVGRLLAERLGLPHIDTDDLIVERTGHTVREIFEAEGEDAFRALETQVLLEALAATEPVVLAAAGGVVLAETNRQALRESGAFVVWLRADPSVLAGRVVGQGHRPLIDADPAGTLAQMLTARERLYRDVSTVEIGVEDKSPEQVTEWIVETLRARGAPSRQLTDERPLSFGDVAGNIIGGIAGSP